MSSSRFTVDTNILRVRDVFALNPNNNDYIQAGQNLLIGEKGKFTWLSTTEYLSSLYISSLSTNVFNLLSNTQTAVSTLSTITGSTITSYLQSTVNNLGSLGYVSSATLDTLSWTTYRLISSTTLYDCLANLGNMSNIGYLGTMQFNGGSNLSGGYVSTIVPGQYKTYYSSITLSPNNVYQTVMNNVVDINLGVIDIAGFQNNSTITSKMIVDVIFNGKIASSGGTGNFTLNTFLTRGGTATVIGTSNVVTGYMTPTDSSSIASAKFYLSPDDLSVFPGSLELHATYNSGAGTSILTTIIPEKGGVFITLDNRD